MKKFAISFFALFIVAFLFSSCGSMQGSLSSSLVNLEGYDYASSPIKNGEFKTEYNKNLKNRTINLKIASKEINNTIIMPGEIFSFNDIVGETTEEKGYKAAKIFLKGEEIEGIGGGICQVSSTLYNAADNVGLEIIERHSHSKPVYYVEKNRDAATAFGSVDLKIKNNFNFPIKIVCHSKDGETIVRLERII